MKFGENNDDFLFFYHKVFGVNPAECHVNVELNDDGVSLTFECLYEDLKPYYENKKTFSGKFERYVLKDLMI